MFVSNYKIRFMKNSYQFIKSMIACVALLCPFCIVAQTANLQFIPSGSLVIPMDTVYQSIVPAGQAHFNLKAYGLVNEFLQNGIPVKWAIKTQKELNDIDFTAVAERVAPSQVAAMTMDFSGGPFIVPDTILPCGLTTMQIIAAFGGNVTAYRLTQATTVDVRYTLTHHPKIAVFNNGGNQLIHTKILDAAGIGNYTIMDAADIDELINCFTFASEPHADSSEVSQDVINGVKAFVLNGGNFLAQCHAIDAYENRGFFQTTGGITRVNAAVNNQYPNSDLPYSQLQGMVQLNEGGSISNWTLKPGSTWQPYTYRSVVDIADDTVVAMGAHLTAPNQAGGNVYYLGGHDYSKGGKPNTGPNLASLPKLNALRMYLNAVFVPSSNSNGAWANAGPPSLTIACDDSVVLGCSQTGPLGSSFLWTPAAGLSCTTCPNPVAHPSVSTTYTVQVTNGCIATDTVRVVVGPKPVALFSNATVCQGTSTSFNDESTTATFWHWDFGDSASGANNTSTLQHPTHTFSASGSFTVTLISGISANCSDTLTKTVVVIPIPIIKVNTPTICEGQSAVLTAQGASTYSWSTGASSSSIIVNPITTTSYVVTGTQTGCSAKDTVTVTVVPKMVPTVSVIAVSCFGGSDGTASVTVTGGQPNYSYSWNTSPTQTNASITGLTKGTYTLTITDAMACSTTVSAVINEPPLIVLKTSSINVKCYNGHDGSVTVTASGGIPSYAYSWNTVPIQSTPQAVGLGAGTYKVTVVDAKACSTSIEATVAEPPQATYTTVVSDVKCFNGNDGTASINIVGGMYTYIWNTNPVQTTATATALMKGTYIVVATDTSGCVLKDTLVVKEPTVIKLSTTVSHPTCVDGGKASVLASGGTAPYTYHWSSAPIQATSLAVNLPAGSYKATVTDANNCKRDTVLVLLPAATPVADFDFNSVCLGDQSTNFKDRSQVLTGPVSATIVGRSWDFGDPSSSNNSSLEINPSHLFGEAKVYQTTLVITTSQGCKDTIVKPVEVFPIPEVGLGPGAEACSSACVNFKDASKVASGFIKAWLWNFGDATSANNMSTVQHPSHCYGKPGDYDVKLQVVTNHGCTAVGVAKSLVKVHPAPVINLDAYKRMCPETENSIRMHVDAGKGSSYLWHPSGDTTQYLMVTAPGTYGVTVTNHWGCSADATTVIRPVCPPRLFISNSFSPNGDGINDLYNVYTAHVGKFQMLVFNRWGEIIFESNDKNRFWDGIYRNEPMPIGVYEWVITYEGDSEEYLGPYKQVGAVTVVR